MEDYISHNEIKYKKRRIALKIRRYIGKFQAIVLTGARQVGKSTMLQNEFPEFTYITLDDFDALDGISNDPRLAWRDSDLIIIDEAQKLPALFSAVKFAADKYKNKRFILSGSSNLLLMKNVAESLAGRALYFDMLPMTYGEIEGVMKPENFLSLWNPDFNPAAAGPANALTAVPPASPVPYVLKGFMPSMLKFSERNDELLWLDGYVRTYLERDLRELSQVDSLVDFRKLMKSLALRTANILNQASVASDSGLSHTTAHRYIKLLEISNIIKLIGGFFNSRGKRIIKSPKIFFTDPGLSVFLSGYIDIESLSKAREIGAFFETMVFLHLKSLCESMEPAASVYYWRTASGKEIDFVIEHGRRLMAVEVKLTQSPKTSDIKNLLSFMDDYPETITGVLVHAGTDVRRLHSKVICVPWWWLDI